MSLSQLPPPNASNIPPQRLPPPPTSAAQAPQPTPQQHSVGNLQQVRSFEVVQNQYQQPMPCARPPYPSPAPNTFVLYSLHFCPPLTSVCFGCGNPLKPCGMIIDKWPTWRTCDSLEHAKGVDAWRTVVQKASEREFSLLTRVCSEQTTFVCSTAPLPCAKRHKTSTDPFAPTIYQRQPGNTNIDRGFNAEKPEASIILIQWIIARTNSCIINNKLSFVTDQTIQTRYRNGI